MEIVDHAGPAALARAFAAPAQLAHTAGPLHDGAARRFAGDPVDEFLPLRLAPDLGRETLEWSCFDNDDRPHRQAL
jgi:hypothetical protein